jgi:hypothetical protein
MDIRIPGKLSNKPVTGPDAGTLVYVPRRLVYAYISISIWN